MSSPQSGKFKIDGIVNRFTYPVSVGLLDRAQGSLATYRAQSQTWNFWNLDKHAYLTIQIPKRK